MNSPKLKSLTVEDHLDAQKTREWLQFPSLTLVDQIVQINLSPADIEALKEGKTLAVGFEGTRLLISPSESRELASGRGPIQESPMFLMRALRRHIYQLQQTAAWPDGNDIRLHVPQERFIDFMTAWIKVFPPADYSARQVVEDRIIEIDGIRIPVKETFGDSVSLGVFRAGSNELIKWIAKFEAVASP